MFRVEEQQALQNGWECFDIAINQNRQELVNFALENSGLIEFRKLLAPEIRHAAALTAVYMNLNDEVDAKLVSRIIELFGIADALQEKAEKAQLEAQAYALLASGEGVELPRFALPKVMHTHLLKDIVNSYLDAHEQMRGAVSECNKALGKNEGEYLSLEELDAYFKKPEHQNQIGYPAYLEQRLLLLAPYEAALEQYCLDRNIYEQYIREYYARRGWVSFQRSFKGEENTSMVDIAAKKLQGKIIIHDRNDFRRIWHVTAHHGEHEYHVAHDGHCHFVKLIPLTAEQGLGFNSVGSTTTVASGRVAAPLQLPNVFTPTIDEQSKREDLLPGLAGGFYQGEVAIHYMLKAIQDQAHFEIQTEVGELLKWDDIKIQYANRETQKITRIVYIQSKHGYEKTSMLLPGNFYNKSGKAQMTLASGECLVSSTDVFTLYEYLEDWIRFKRNLSVSGTPEIEIDAQPEFVLFSNRKLCEKVPGFNECFEGNPKHLTRDFIDGTGIYSRKFPLKTPGERAQVDFRNKLFSGLLSNTPSLLQDPRSNVEKEQIIKAFLREVSFRLGEEHIDEMEKSNKTLVNTLYPHANSDSIYYAFRFVIHKWLRAKTGSTSLTDVVVLDLLERAKKSYLVLGAQIGETNFMLRQTLCGPRVVINRSTVKERFSEEYQTLISNEKNILVMSGPEQSGRTYFLCQYFREKIQRGEMVLGEFLYIDLQNTERSSSQFSAFEEKGLRTVVLDGICKLGNENLSEVQSYLQHAIKHRKKLILVIKDEQLPLINTLISDKDYLLFRVDFLSQEEVSQTLKEYCGGGVDVQIGKKTVLLENLLKNVGPVAGKPGFLSDIIVHAHTDPRTRKQVVSNDADFYIEPEIVQYVPLYSLGTLLQVIRPFFCAINPGKGVTSSRMVEVIRKNYVSAISIRIEDLIKESEKNNFNFGEYIAKKQNDKTDGSLKKEDSDPSGLLLVILDPDNKSQQLPKHLLDSLKKQSKVLFLTSRDTLESLATTRLTCAEVSDTDLMVEYSGSDLDLKPQVYQPRETKQTRVQLTKDLSEMPAPLILEAPEGAGKTSFIGKLKSQWIASKTMDDFVWVQKIKLNKMRKFANKQSLLEVIIQYQNPPLNLWQQAVLEYAFKNNRMLLILDAWDEVKKQQREEYQALIKEIFSYRNLLVTTRGSDRGSLSLTHYQIVSLSRFKFEDIKEFVHKYFGDSKFSSPICDYLAKTESQQMVDLIGTPMECYLLCEALQPHFKRWLANPNTETMWSDGQPLSKASLYRLFVSARLQGYLIKHEKMPETSVTEGKAYRRTFFELQALRQSAYRQMFNQDALIIEEIDRNVELEDAVDYFGFGYYDSHGGVFDFHYKHHTYREYFAALYLVEILGSAVKEKIDKALVSINNHLFEPRYNLVWQFVAGIVSYGDPQIGQQAANQALFIFWRCMLQGPDDLIGIRHHQLVKDCVRNSHWPALEKTALGRTLRVIYQNLGETVNPLLDITAHSIEDQSLEAGASSSQRTLGTITPVSPEKPTTPRKDVETLITELKQYIDLHFSSSNSFKGKGHILSEIARQISQLETAINCEDDRVRCEQYLTSEIKEKCPSSSLVINAAITEALGKVGKKSDTVGRNLRAYLTHSENKPRLKAVESLLALGYPFDEGMLDALVHASRDKYGNDQTWIAREALATLQEVTPDDESVIRKIYRLIPKESSEELVQAFFGCLGKTTKFRSVVAELISNTAINRSFHVYACLTLCDLGQDYQLNVIDIIIKQKKNGLIPKLILLLNPNVGKQRMQLAFSFLMEQTPSAMIIEAICTLLKRGLVQFNQIKNYLIKALGYKNVTEIVIKLFVDTEKMTKEILDTLLSHPLGGFWLIDGGLPAIGKLGGIFNEQLANYLIDIIEHHYSDSGVSTALSGCMSELFGSQAMTKSTCLSQIIRVLTALTDRIEKYSEMKESYIYLLKRNIDDALDHIPARLGLEVLWDSYRKHRSNTVLYLFVRMAITQKFAIVVSSSEVRLIGTEVISFAQKPLFLDQLGRDIVAIRNKLVRDKILPCTPKLEMVDNADALVKAGSNLLLMYQNSGKQAKTQTLISAPHHKERAMTF